MLSCSWKESFGFDCFFCGIQRSFFLLCQGDIIGSLAVYPALLPFLFVVVFTGLHLFFKFKNGSRLIIISFSFAAFVMVIHLLIKIIDGSAFQ